MHTFNGELNGVRVDIEAVRCAAGVPSGVGDADVSDGQALTLVFGGHLAVVLSVRRGEDAAVSAPFDLEALTLRWIGGDAAEECNNVRSRDDGPIIRVISDHRSILN